MSRPVRDGRAEFDFLSAIARPKPDYQLGLDTLRRGIYWPGLLQLATAHGVRPHLIQALRDFAWEGVPPDTKSALEAFQHLHLTRMLALIDELRRIASVFTSLGLPFATFKGVTLATAHHTNRSLREFRDIDLIVAKPQMEKAEFILQSLGYSSVQGDVAFRKAFFAYQRQYAFIRADIQIVVDLHWAFTSVRLPFPLKPAEIWTELQSESIGGLPVPTLSGANLALLLAGHGTKERWRCLGWVCDFATCIERNPDLDWYAVFLRARQRGCGNTILLGCALAKDLLGVPVPEEISTFVESSSRVRTLTASITRCMRDNFFVTTKARNLADLDLCDTWSRKAGYILGMVFTRTKGDYDAMPLPPWLWRLYHLTRPFRLGSMMLSPTGRESEAVN